MNDRKEPKSVIRGDLKKAGYNKIFLIVIGMILSLCIVLLCITIHPTTSAYVLLGLFGIISILILKPGGVRVKEINPHFRNVFSFSSRLGREEEGNNN
jgi:hypothetical protein